jgi:hypothetical protein
MSNQQNDIIAEDKREYDLDFNGEIYIPAKEFDIWQLEQDIKRLPEIELMHIYEIVESRLEKEFGKRLHL